MHKHVVLFPFIALCFSIQHCRFYYKKRHNKTLAPTTRDGWKGLTQPTAAQPISLLLHDPPRPCLKRSGQSQPRRGSGGWRQRHARASSGCQACPVARVSEGRDRWVGGEQREAKEVGVCQVMWPAPSGPRGCVSQAAVSGGKEGAGGSGVTGREGSKASAVVLCAGVPRRTGGGAQAEGHAAAGQEVAWARGASYRPAKPLRWEGLGGGAAKPYRSSSSLLLQHVPDGHHIRVVGPQVRLLDAQCALQQRPPDVIAALQGGSGGQDAWAVRKAASSVGLLDAAPAAARCRRGSAGAAAGSSTGDGGGSLLKQDIMHKERKIRPPANATAKCNSCHHPPSPGG